MHSTGTAAGPVLTMKVDPDGWLGRARQDMLHQGRFAHLTSAFHEQHRLMRHRIRDESFESALATASSVWNIHIYTQ